MTKKIKRERREAARAAAEAAQNSSGAPTPKPAAPSRAAPRLAIVPDGLQAVLKSRWFLPLALLLAVLLRVAHVVALSSSPFFEYLSLDCLVYDEWAQRIAAGEWMGNRVFYQDPLYPYLLGALYSVVGRSFWVVYLLQVGFGVGTCWLTALLGRRVFGVAVGNLAGLLAALFTPSLFYEAQVEKTFLSVFLVAGFLVLALDRRNGARLAAGAVLALATLTRANLLVFLPLTALVLLGARVGRLAAGSKPGEANREGAIFGNLARRDSAAFDFLRPPTAVGVRAAAAFLAGAALVLVPVLLRNHHIGGTWALTTSQAGQNFYIGNNPLNTTGSYIVPPSIRPDPRYEETDFRAEAERQTGRELTAAEVSEFWTEQSWDHINAHPVFAQMMLLRKFLLFWNNYEVPDNLDMALVQRWSLPLRLPLLGFGLLAALALVGAVAAFATSVETRLLVAFVALYCLTVVAFFIFSRYRIQVAPVLLVFAAYGLLWMVAQTRGARWENVGGALAGLLLAGAFCFQTLEWIDPTKALAISLNNLGALYREAGDTPRAIASYEEAAELSPAGVPAALRLLGDYYLREGKFDRAEHYMRQVVTVRPDSRMGWNALVELYYAMRNRGDSSPALSVKLADALRSAGRAEEARGIDGK